jgi:hypothetical protein
MKKENSIDYGILAEQRRQAEANSRLSVKELKAGDFLFLEECTDKNCACPFECMYDAACHDGVVHNSLARIEKIVDVSLEDFSHREDYPFGDGGSASDAVTEERTGFNYTQEELATFYSLVTLVNLDDGRHAFVDAQGFGYPRYVLVSPDYKEMFAKEIRQERLRYDAYEFLSQLRDSKALRDSGLVIGTNGHEELLGCLSLLRPKDERGEALTEEEIAQKTAFLQKTAGYRPEERYLLMDKSTGLVRSGDGLLALLPRPLLKSFLEESRLSRTDEDLKKSLGIYYELIEESLLHQEGKNNKSQFNINTNSTMDEKKEENQKATTVEKEQKKDVDVSKYPDIRGTVSHDTEKNTYYLNVYDKDEKVGVRPLMSGERFKFFSFKDGEGKPDKEKMDGYATLMAVRYVAAKEVRKEGQAQKAPEDKLPRLTDEEFNRMDLSDGRKIDQVGVFKMLDGNYGIRAKVDGRQLSVKPLSWPETGQFFNHTASKAALVEKVYSKELSAAKEEKQAVSMKR